MIPFVLKCQVTHIQHLQHIRPSIASEYVVYSMGRSGIFQNWYHLINLQKGVKTLFDLEEKFLGNLQQAPSRVHNALRNVGRFPLIITTNMDELLERFLWKTGNGGEKLRLDQVGRFGPNEDESNLSLV